MESETREYKGNFIEIFNSCLNAIENLNWNISSSDDIEGIIEANTNASLLSWGEDIDIRLQDMNGIVSVIISSEAPAQLIDWGKNAKNIETFFPVLESLISSNK